MLALAAGAAVPGSAEAAPAASTKVYLDAETGRFSGPLPQHASRVVTVETRARSGARLTLSYWSLRRNETCPAGEHDKPLTDEQIGRATIRSFAPIGNPNTDKTQNYETSLGPLLYGVKYCFHLSGAEPRPLDAREKADVSEALREAIEGARMRQLKDGYGATCPPGQSAETKVCEIRHTFASLLPPRLATMRVAIPDTPEVLLLPEAFEVLVRSNRPLFLQLSEGLAVGAERRRAIEELEAQKQGILALNGVYVFDPMAGLSRDDLLSFASNDEVKRLITQAGDDRRALLRVLFTTKVYAHFVSTAPWNANAQQRKKKPSDPGSVLYRVFHRRDGAGERLRLPDDPPPFVTIDQDYRVAIANAIDNHPLDPAKGVQSFRSELATLSNALGHRDAAGIELLDALAVNVELAASAARDVDALNTKFVQNFAPRADGAPSVFVADLVDRMTAVESLAAKNDFAFDPNYAQRFPLYASGDAGIAIGILPVANRDPRTELVAYFGLNLYFTAVDKEEPLQVVQRPGRNFLRRFSVVGGVSFIRPDIQDDEFDIDGALRQQVLLSGVGIRATDYLRFGAGAMYFTQMSPNPLSDRRELKAAPYLSISIDVDIIGQINRWRGPAQSASAAPPAPPPS
ncbi:MAG: hypothetical protein AAF799_26395 [Myxococcota bacterium]